MTHRTIETGSQAVHDILVEWAPERPVVEVGTVTGWVHDIAVGLGIDGQVANPSVGGWCWAMLRDETN